MFFIDGRLLRGPVDPTPKPRGCQSCTGSPPSRGRGSKRLEYWPVQALVVAPFAGAWIETSPPRRGRKVRSLLRGRGSKKAPMVPTDDDSKSPPSRGRGSKRSGPRALSRVACRPFRGGVDRKTERAAATGALRVAPFAGAWIESLAAADHGKALCPPLRGGVIETAFGHGLANPSCRPLRGGVDRNMPGTIQPGRGRRPSRGSIETSSATISGTAGRPFAGAWIETA